MEVDQNGLGLTLLLLELLEVLEGLVVSEACAGRISHNVSSSFDVTSSKSISEHVLKGTISTWELIQLSKVEGKLIIASDISALVHDVRNQSIGITRDVDDMTELIDDIESICLSVDCTDEDVGLGDL